jgi:V/A-type H+-transporting ATPase subunit C
MESLKFFQGDEGIISDLYKSQIDKKNILTLLKGRESNLERELITKHLVKGGNIILDELFDIYTSKNIEEFINKVEKYYNLTDILKDTYMKTHSLIDFEVAFDKYINKTYLKRLKSISLSLGIIFYFMIKAEYEWDNIKRIAYGKRYDLPIERIHSMLILE